MTVQEELTLYPFTINMLYIVHAMLGVVTLGFVISRLNDIDISFNSSDQQAFFALAILGMTM